MTDTSLVPLPDPMAQLYADMVGNLAARNRILRDKLPTVATAASDPELVTLIGQCLTVAVQHDEALADIASRGDAPTRLHAVELDTLLGTTARETANWEPRARDLALGSLLRGAIHLGIPSYELAASLAKELLYAPQERTLTRLREDLTVLDSQTQQIMQTLVTGEGVAERAPAASATPRTDTRAARESERSDARDARL